MVLARFFKLIFRIPFFRKYYFGLYTKVFRPKRWFEGKVVTTHYRGDILIRLELDEWIQQQVYFFGFYDPRGIAYLERELKPGQTFIDIGANVGCYSLVAARSVGSKGKVISFEPVEHVFQQLSYNLGLNGFHWATAEKKAVFDKETELTIHLAGEENRGMSSMFRHDAENGFTEKVQAITLDKYLKDQQVERVDLIKLDIEGAELFALKGMIETISTFRPAMITELLDPDTAAGMEIIELMKGLNYQAFSLDENGKRTPFRKYTVAEAYYNYLFLPEEKVIP